MNIIAIRSSRSTDKSKTINYLRDLMVQYSFNEIGGNYGKHITFWSVLERNGKKVGITTFGNTYNSLAAKLDILNKNGCKLIVCNCLCLGQTNDLIENKPGFSFEYINKTTLIKKAQGSLSHADALQILARINQLL